MNPNITVIAYKPKETKRLFAKKESKLYFSIPLSKPTINKLAIIIISTTYKPNEKVILPKDNILTLVETKGKDIGNSSL